MKKLMFLMLAGVLTLVSCGTQLLGTDKAQLADNSEAVCLQRVLSSRHYRIKVTQMYPRKGGSRFVDTGYFLEVKGDTLDSYLPYTGQVYRATISGADNLNFTSRILKYSSVRKKGNKTVINLGVHSREDYYTYTLTVYDNGKADVDVNARNRDNIRFDGEYVE